jgi:hypothetical protein
MVFLLGLAHETPLASLSCLIFVFVWVRPICKLGATHCIICCYLKQVIFIISLLYLSNY